MFNEKYYEEHSIERDEDFDNTESNAYLANVYAQLSMCCAANERTLVALQDIDF